MSGVQGRDLDPAAARALARAAFDAALAAASPVDATLRAFADDPALAAEVEGARGEVRVIAAGKAAAAMAEAALARFGARIDGGVVVTPHAQVAAAAGRLGPLALVGAGHPLPDAGSLAAAAAVEAAVRGRSEGDVVIALISGGASSLLAAPPPGVDLMALRATGAALLASGAPIAAVNAVRRHLSRLGGGGLAALAAPARVIGLALSDVVGDPLEAIGSGPIVGDPTTFADAIAAVEAHALGERLPACVVEHLRAGAAGARAETVKPGDRRLRRASAAVIAGGRQAAAAMVAALRGRGVDAALLSSTVEGEARELGRLYAALARGLGSGEPGRSLPAAWVLAGEATVTLGARVGVGGRNLEAALAAAVALDGRDRVLVACLASDGRDGASDAAGALVDGATVARARALGLDPARALAEHDADGVFAALGDRVVTGPTGTNVADLALVLAW